VAQNANWFGAPKIAPKHQEIVKLMKTNNKPSKHSMIDIDKRGMVKVLKQLKII